MIKNILFDMGNVLIRFDPHRFIRRYTDSEADEQILLRRVFQTCEWVRMDRGSLKDEEAAEFFASRVPDHLKDTARALTLEWDHDMIPLEGMEDLIRELKEAGYGIYLLSNASLRQPLYWPNIPGSQYFDDVLISSYTGFVKPQPEIFREAFRKFGVRPEECLFVDDVPLNVEGAFFSGMDGIVYHGDTEELREEMAARGVLTGRN